MSSIKAIEDKTPRKRRGKVFNKGYWRQNASKKGEGMSPKRAIEDKPPQNNNKNVLKTKS